MSENLSESKRVIEENVPGKQITLAHVVASPIKEVYQALGIDEVGAIGILTLSPYETSIIAADIAAKAADVNIGFLDRFTGSVVITGDVKSVEVALAEVIRVFQDNLGFCVVPVTHS